MEEQPKVGPTVLGKTDPVPLRSGVHRRRRLLLPRPARPRRARRRHAGRHGRVQEGRGARTPRASPTGQRIQLRRPREAPAGQGVERLQVERQRAPSSSPSTSGPAGCRSSSNEGSAPNPDHPRQEEPLQGRTRADRRPGRDARRLRRRHVPHRLGHPRHAALVRGGAARRTPASCRASSSRSTGPTAATASSSAASIKPDRPT